MNLDNLIKRLEILRARHGGDIPIFSSVTDSMMGGHAREVPITELYLGFISENNPIWYSGDLEPQINRVTIFQYPRFQNLDDTEGIIYD